MMFVDPDPDYDDGDDEPPYGAYDIERGYAGRYRDGRDEGHPHSVRCSPNRSRRRGGGGGGEDPPPTTSPVRAPTSSGRVPPFVRIVSIK